MPDMSFTTSQTMLWNHFPVSQILKILFLRDQSIKTHTVIPKRDVCVSYVCATKTTENNQNGMH